MDRLSKALNDFQNWLKGNGNKVATKEITRRAVLTKFGFIIYADIEVPDHPDFLKKKSDIESRSNEMATRHDKEVWTYIAQGFPGSRSRPSAEMVGQRLKTNPDFRSGLLKLQDRHKTEYAALKGELKTAIEDNEIYKQEARSEQVRSMTTDQKRELVNESSRARYQTEEGKLDRQYRNINHYGRQGERIKEVQRTRYQEDEDFRAKQIERSRARLQKPGIKELGAAEARERTRLKNNPLNEQCDCGCNGNLKTHRANFRKKFWSEYNPVKEGGFKILIAGIDNDAYWNGESWRRCIIADKQLIADPNDISWIPKEKGWKPGKWKNQKPGYEKYEIHGAYDPQGNFHPTPGTHKNSNLTQKENDNLNSAINGIRINNITNLKLNSHNININGKGQVPTSNRGSSSVGSTIDRFGLGHPESNDNSSAARATKSQIRTVYNILGEDVPKSSALKSVRVPPIKVTKYNDKGEPIDGEYQEAVPGIRIKGDKVVTEKIRSTNTPHISRDAENIHRNNDPEGKHRLICGSCGEEIKSDQDWEWSHPHKSLTIRELNPEMNSEGVTRNVMDTIRPEHTGCHRTDEVANGLRNTSLRSSDNSSLPYRHPLVQSTMDLIKKHTGIDYDALATSYIAKQSKRRLEFNDKQKKEYKKDPTQFPDHMPSDEEINAWKIRTTVQEQVGRIDDIKTKKRQGLLKSPEPTYQTVNPEDFDIEGLIKPRGKSLRPWNKTKIINGVLHFHEGREQQTKNGNYTGKRDRNPAFKQEKQKQNLSNPNNQALIKSREKLFPKAYADFKKKMGRNPYVCELTGHDEVTWALSKKGKHVQFENDHDRKELDDYKSEGEYANPARDSILVNPQAHGDAKKYRKAIKLKLLNSGIQKQSKKWFKSMSDAALSYRRTTVEQNIDMFNPLKQSQVLSGLKDRSQLIIANPEKKKPRKRTRTSSWNGFKVLDNL